MRTEEIAVPPRRRRGVAEYLFDHFLWFLVSLWVVWIVLIILGVVGLYVGAALCLFVLGRAIG